jgi:hypothetical protein
MIPNHRFEHLYAQLVSAWDSHQSLRRAEAPFARLAEATIRLYEARSAMAAWHRRQDTEEI